MFKKINFISFFFQIVSGVILLMASYSKLVDSADSLQLFSALNAKETLVVVGVLELFAGLSLVLNFIPQIGALIGLCVMLGAFIAHISVLGIEVNNDGGQLFLTLLVVLVSNTIVLWMNRKRLPLIGSTL